MTSFLSASISHSHSHSNSHSQSHLRTMGVAWLRRMSCPQHHDHHHDHHDHHHHHHHHHHSSVIDPYDATCANKDNPKELLKILNDLDGKEFSMDLMLKGGLGKVANKLRKHGNKQVAKLASKIVTKWRTEFRKRKKPSTIEGGGDQGQSAAAAASSSSSSRSKKQKTSSDGDSKFEITPAILAGVKDDEDDANNRLDSSKWPSSKSSSSSSKYPIESSVNPDRVRLVEPHTFQRERPKQLDIGVKAKVVALSMVHPSPAGSVETKAKGPVVYWMSREQRSFDNWALLYAQEEAIARGVGLVVVFNLVPSFLEATKRHFGFMLRGLRHTQKRLEELNIPLRMVYGDPKDSIPNFIQQHDCSCLVCDFSPMRIAYIWKQQVFSALNGSIPFYEVDAHNVVPVWKASDKLEYGARTIRKRIHTKLDTYLTRFPQVKSQELELVPDELWPKTKEEEHQHRISFKALLEQKVMKIDMTVDELSWCDPGEHHAQETALNFLTQRAYMFDSERNDPCSPQALSGISPYLHFGQIAPQRMILEAFEVKRSSKNKSANYIKSLDGFIEEALVRRELAENYCFYNPHYDSLHGCWNWARTTLDLHKDDKREKVFTLEQLEQAKTHDQLWNAAQKEMVYHGKMHGFMRMYWAKKILEWTSSPAEALKSAIYLNDKYSIDGRDPNGYTGIMWSIAGVHDQGWKERPVFGKIRYMAYSGCKRKFDISRYINNVNKLVKRLK